MKEFIDLLRILRLKKVLVVHFCNSPLSLFPGLTTFDSTAPAAPLQRGLNFTEHKPLGHLVLGVSLSKNQREEI
jgi:hypothetical protein